MLNSVTMLGRRFRIEDGGTLSECQLLPHLAISEVRLDANRESGLGRGTEIERPHSSAKGCGASLESKFQWLTVVKKLADGHTGVTFAWNVEMSEQREIVRIRIHVRSLRLRSVFNRGRAMSK